MNAPTSGNHANVARSGVRAPPSTVRKPTRAQHGRSPGGGQLDGTAGDDQQGVVGRGGHGLVRLAEGVGEAATELGRRVRREPDLLADHDRRGPARAQCVDQRPGVGSRSGCPVTHVPSESSRTTPSAAASTPGRAVGIGALHRRPRRRPARPVGVDAGGVVGVGRVEVRGGHVGHGAADAGEACGHRLGHRRLARPGAAEHEHDHGWPLQSLADGGVHGSADAGAPRGTGPGERLDGQHRRPQHGHGVARRARALDPRLDQRLGLGLGGGHDGVHRRRPTTDRPAAARRC